MMKTDNMEMKILTASNNSYIMKFTKSQDRIQLLPVYRNILARILCMNSSFSSNWEPWQEAATLPAQRTDQNLSAPRCLARIKFMFVYLRFFPSLYNS